MPSIASELPRSTPAPLLDGRRSRGEQVLVLVFTAVPLLALAAAVPLAWGWGLTWLDVGLALGLYVLSGLGVTVGFHRYFTHGSFKTGRPLHVALAVAGSLALQGSVVTPLGGETHSRHNR